MVEWIGDWYLPIPISITYVRECPHKCPQCIILVHLVSGDGKHLDCRTWILIGTAGFQYLWLITDCYEWFEQIGRYKFVGIKGI